MFLLQQPSFVGTVEANMADLAKFLFKSWRSKDILDSSV
jgi:hypothetical protein